MDEDGSLQSGQHDVGCVEITEINKPVAVSWIWSMSIPSGSGSSGVFSITPSFLATKQSLEASHGRDYTTTYPFVVSCKQAVCPQSGHEPDNSRIISGSWDNTVRIWDTHTGQELATLLGHSGRILDCAVSPDGQWVASAAENLEVKIWETRKGTPLPTSFSPVGTCVLSGDGKTCLTIGEDSLRVFDTSTGAERYRHVGIDHWTIHYRVRTPDQPTFFDGGITADSTRILVDYYDMQRGRLVSALDAASGDEISSLYPAPRLAGVRSALSPDGTYLLFHNWLVETVGWTKRRASVFLFRDPGPFPEMSYLISADNRFVVQYLLSEPQGFTVDDEASEIWIRKLLHDWKHATLRVNPGGLTACAIGPDARSLAAGDTGGTLHLWDIRTRRRRFALPLTFSAESEERGYSITCCAFHPDGTLLLASATNGQIFVVDVSTGKQLLTINAHQYGRSCVCAVSPDGRWVISAGSDTALRLWELTTGREVSTLWTSSPLQKIVLHAWEPLAIACGNSGQVNFAELLGITYDAIIVAPKKIGQQLLAECPKCGEALNIAMVDLSLPHQCPTPGCGLVLRLAPFVLQPAITNWPVRQRGK